MTAIENTIAVYERVRRRRYKITIEDGTQFILCFSTDNYHHLVGFQHLTDVANVYNPYSKHRFYRSLKNHGIAESQILSSVHFNEIEERIRYFDFIEKIVSAGECRAIVEFDSRKASSDIAAKFLLFERDGCPLLGQPVTYYNLFIDHDNGNGLYYPVTYIVEHSVKYISNQNVFDCKIEVI